MGQGFDAVVHLAAKKAVGESMVNPGLYAENNLNGAVNILNRRESAGFLLVGGGLRYAGISAGR